MQPLDEAGQALAEEAVDRARMIADRYARLFPQYAADFESSANWGVVRAAASYDPDKPGKAEVWGRWSTMCIKLEIKELLRSNYAKHFKLWPHEALEGVVGDEGVSLECESAESLDRLLATLPKRHRELCSLVYKNNITPSEAGQALGLGKKQGCRIHQQALAYLRDAPAA